jgi:hypothetical protein
MVFSEKQKLPDDESGSGAEGVALLPQGRCPVCRYQIHVLEEGNAAVIKAAVIKADLRSKRTLAKCPKCKQWLIVPLQYRPERWSGFKTDRFI